ARATPRAVAIRYEHENGTRRDFTYKELDASADRLAAALCRRGVERGDRVAIVMPQRFETAVAHIALYRLRAVARPASPSVMPRAAAMRIGAACSKRATRHSWPSRPRPTIRPFSSTRAARPGR